MSIEVSIDFKVSLSNAEILNLSISDRTAYFYDSLDLLMSDIRDSIHSYLRQNDYGTVIFNNSLISMAPSYGTSLFRFYATNVYFTFPILDVNGFKYVAWGIPNNSPDYSSLDYINVIPPGGEVGDPPPFSPPSIGIPDNIDDVSFYDKLKATHDLLALDGLSSEEWDYLSAMQKKNEMEIVNKLIQQSQDDFINASESGVYDNVYIRYDAEDTDTTAFYTANGLDINKDYYTNLKATGVGYADPIDGGLVTGVNTVNSNGNSTLTLESAKKLVENGVLIGGLTAIATGETALSGGVLGGSGGVPQLMGIALVEYLEKKYGLGEKVVDTFVDGTVAWYNTAKNLYNGFTATGDRSIDYVNQNVQQAYNNIMESKAVALELPKDFFLPVVVDLDTKLPVTIPEEAAIGVSADGVTVGVNTDGKVIGLSVDPNIKLPIGILPTDLIKLDTTTAGAIAIDLDLKLPIGGLPIDVTGKSLDINTDGKTVGVNTEGKSVALDTTDATLPSDPNNPWLALMDLIMKFLACEVVKNDLELGITSFIDGDGVVTASKTKDGIRDIEKDSANWVVQDYNSTVLEGVGEEAKEVNKIERSLQTWQNLHSLNTNIEYDGVVDSSGNNMNMKKGLVPSLFGMGMGEFFREGALKTLSGNNINNLMDELRVERDNHDDSNNDPDYESVKESILLGIKKIMFPLEADFQSSLLGEFGDDFKEIASHFLKTEVK